MGLTIFKNPTEDIQFLIDLADHASSAILKIYDSEHGVVFKGDQSPVTHADLIADAIICKGILSRWPDTFILSEESRSNTKEQSPRSFWAVDPLDGTKEFINKNGQFTVNIAWVENGQPILGLIAAPALDVLYVGWVGHYAKKRLKQNWSTLSKVGAEANWLNTEQVLRVAASRSHPSPELDDWLSQYPHHIVNELGSSLKICAVAEGLADCYPRLGRTCYWDIAAGHAILSAVGGNIWQWPVNKRTPLCYLDINSPFNEYFIASGSY